MATLDLSRIDTQISGVGRGREIFSTEGGSAWQALAKTSGDVADIAFDLYKKQQDIDTTRSAATALNSYQQEVTLESARAYTNIDIETGKVKDQHGNLTEKNYADYMADWSNEKLDKHRSQLTEPMALSKFEPSAASWKTEQDKSNIWKTTERTIKDVSITRAHNVSKSSDKIRLSDPYHIVDSFNNAIADSEKDNQVIEMSAGLSTVQSLQIDGRRTLITSAVDASILAAETNKAGIYAYNELTGGYFLPKTVKGVTKYDNDILNSLENSGITPEEYTQALVDLKVIDADGNPTEPVTPVTTEARESYKFITPAEKARNDQKVMSIILDRAKENKHNTETLNILLGEAENIGKDLGTQKLTAAGMSRIQGGLSAVVALRNNPEFKDNIPPIKWLKSMLNADMAYASYLDMKNPTRHLQKGRQGATDISIVRIKNILTQTKDVELLDTLKKYESLLGTTLRAQHQEKSSAIARKIQVSSIKQPLETAIMYGSESLNRKIKGMYNANGTVNTKGYMQVADTLNREFGEVLAGYNKDLSVLVLGDITSRVVESNKILLETGDPTQVADALVPILSMEPKLGAAMLTTMQDTGKLKPDTAATLWAGLAFKGNSNQALVKEVLSANMGANLKQNALYKDEDEKKSIAEKSTKAVDDFFKHSSNGNMKSSIAEQIKNHVISLKAKDSSIDSDKAVEADVQQLLKNDKTNFNHKYIKGTIKRLPTDPSDGFFSSPMEDRILKKREDVIKGIVKGTTEVDFKWIPGYSERTAPKKGITPATHAIVMRELALGTKYKTVLNTLDDTGSARNFSVSVEDTTTGIKYLLRDKKGNIIKIGVD